MQTSRNGRITGSKAATPSGKPVLDDAVLPGMKEMGTVPKDIDGRAPEALLREGLEIKLRL